MVMEGYKYELLSTVKASNHINEVMNSVKEIVVFELTFSISKIFSFILLYQTENKTINVPELWTYFFWVSSLAYPNLLGKKCYVVVVVAAAARTLKPIIFKQKMTQILDLIISQFTAAWRLADF